MSFTVTGNSGGAGYGSFAMTREELIDDIAYWLDQLRAGEFDGNGFRIEWDQSDEPHVFTRDPSITDERVCRICEDLESNEHHVPERRVTGAARGRR